MASTRPWEDKWKRGQELGKGGQGTTYFVTAKQGELFAENAVLKLLRNQKSPEARRRMYREVANLRALHSAGCDVPRILDTNADQFEVSEVPLYFVMEYISGETLQNHVVESSGLPIDESVQLALKICKTLAIAQKEGILHRDIKPENIILRTSDETVEAPVIVDYGLSFNSADVHDFTRASEALDNRFLSLPERRIPGGDRRDPRSDLTGLCGIFFFCLTAEAPVDLVGPDGNPPHRRLGKSLRDRFGDTIQVSLIEALLDQGFSSNVDTRFQTVDELLKRLKDILEPSAREAEEDPRSFAKKAAQLLLKSDRKTQLAKYRVASAKLESTLNNHVIRYKEEDVSPFLLKPVSFSSTSSPLVGYEPIGVSFLCQVGVQHHENLVVAIKYLVVAKGPQCTILREVAASTAENVKKFKPVEPWVPILWYDGLTGPDTDAAVADLRASILEAMKLLQREILQSSSQPE